MAMQCIENTIENTIQNKVAFLFYGYYNVYVPHIFGETHYHNKENGYGRIIRNFAGITFGCGF